MAGIPQTGDEQALIRAARRGDLSAFNALVLRYQDTAYTVAYRILGEAQAAADAAQESFIVAYRRLETYRGGSFKSWVMRIVTNQCYDELRRLRRRPVVSMEDLGDPESDDGFTPPDPGGTPEQTVQQRELERAIQDCINALSPDQRIVLVLSDIEEMPYQDIADNVGANLGTVKSRLSRARAAVRDCLRSLGELLPGMYRLNGNDD